jgi:hypothetical protein
MKMMTTLEPFRHDSRLPHLAVALNPAEMQAIWQEALFNGSGYTVHNCQIERVRYKPGRNCLVCYRLQVRDQAGKAAGEQLLSARLYEPGVSRSRFARAQQESLTPPRFARPVVHLPAFEMVGWLFPNDRKLKSLADITNPLTLQKTLLPPLVAAHFGEGWRINNLHHQLVHYNPEHTGIVRLQLQLEQVQTGEQQEATLFVKAYESDEGATTYRLMEQLWQATGPALKVAQPLTYQPERRLLWQRGLPGRPLLALEGDEAHLLAGLKQAGAAVASLHQTPAVDYLPSRPVSAWVTQLEWMHDWLPAVRPTCRPLLHPLIERLLAQANQLDEQPATLLHGDLHLQNFFVHGQTIALIDLDNASVGSPWQDVGSFLASLFYRALLLDTPIPVITERVRAFSLTYQQHVPWRTSQRALNWFVAAALLNERAFRCVSRYKDGRPTMIDTLIRLADQLTETGFADE